MKISAILDKIDENQLFVPAFQREYVWKRDDAKQLLDSLIKQYPTGTMLTWEDGVDACPTGCNHCLQFHPTKPDTMKKCLLFTSADTVQTQSLCAGIPESYSLWRG